MNSAPIFRIYGLPWPYFVFVAVIILITVLTGHVDPGLIGVLPLMIVAGTIMQELGDRTPLVRTYLGGGPLVIIFGAAALAAYAPIGRVSLEHIDTFMKGGGFLDFYIASLITGTILGMERSFLIKAAARYLPVIVAATATAFLCAGLSGWVLGFGFLEAVTLVGIPIMGGGMGAGAIPLSQIMAGPLGIEPQQALSKMIPAVALANAMAIVAASLLVRLAKRFPQLSGDGRLMRSEVQQDEVTRERQPRLEYLGTGLLVAVGVYALGTLISQLLPLHAYAAMILAVAFAKALGIVEARIEQAASDWSSFVVGNLTCALLVGIGVAYTDLPTVIEALTPTYLAMVTATLVGAILGASFAARLVNFYPIEAAITAGLCMANMGGSGDVAVLSAARRMQLLPFAQISSRIGGAFIIVIATLWAQFYQ